MPEEERPISYPDLPIEIGRTLAIIKPDATDKSDEIEEIIQQHGFSILQVGSRQTCGFRQSLVHFWFKGYAKSQHFQL